AHPRSTSQELPTIDVHPNAAATNDAAASGSQPRVQIGPSTARPFEQAVAATSAPGSLLPERPSQPLPAAGPHSVAPTNGGAALPVASPAPRGPGRALLV